MADVVALNPVPRIGDVFTDARGDGRSMRVSMHADRGIVVVSLWAAGTCRASFQLPLEDADRLAALLGPAPAADEPYPGLAENDTVHITGAIVPPDLPQAS